MYDGDGDGTVCRSLELHRFSKDNIDGPIYRRSLERGTVFVLLHSIEEFRIGC